MSFIVIDDNLRTMTIPEDIVLLGVESDDDVNKIPFKMPKEYCGFDLSQFEARINYMNAKGEGDIYIVSDLAIDGDDPTMMTFTWVVGRNACKYKGKTRFIVCLKKFAPDDTGDVIQEFNTTVYTLPVLEGLETVDAVVQQNADIIEEILRKLDPSVNIFNASTYIPYERSVIYHSDNLEVTKDGYRFYLSGVNNSPSELEIALFDSNNYSLDEADWHGKTAILSGLYPNPLNNVNYTLRLYVDDEYTDIPIEAETNVVFIDIDVTRIVLLLKLGETYSGLNETFIPYMNLNYSNSQQQLTRDVQSLKQGLIMDVSDVGY